MRSIFIVNRRFLTLFFLAVFSTLISRANTGGGIIAKAVLDGSQHQIAFDSSRTVADSVFFNIAYASDIDTSYAVQNLVSLMINEGSNVYLRDSFTVSVNVELIYSTGANAIDSIARTLTIHYDSAKAYNSRSSFVFNGAHMVTVRVVSVTSSVTSWDPTTALLLENQLIASPDFKFTCTNTVTNITVSPMGIANADELPVSWTSVTGADQYDLEWTYIDSSALSLNLYGDSTGLTPAFSDKIFQNNATRATITGTSYNIPLIYDNTGTLFIRVRAVQRATGNAVFDAQWSSDVSGRNGIGEFSFRGHERPLNWQSSITFAEDGKRKVALEYYDGSLRERQSVTKNNMTDTTIVAETYYDYQGRPVIKVMPTPTLSNIIQYTAHFNQSNNPAYDNAGPTEYSQSNYDTLLNASMYCSIHADSMSNESGASNYYSVNNPKKSGGLNQFIPDALDYPFTETEYTPDNTGRMSRQSDVGSAFQLGSGHEMKYFYGTPSQEELDALFGTEVGDHSHYFKNMVRDPNGQYSITYIDMHSRLIATALAGASPDSLAALPSNTNGAQIIENLSDSNSVFTQNLSMVAHKSLLVPQAGFYTFNYSLSPSTLSEMTCSGQNICYTCAYDLKITITDNCNNQLLGGQPFQSVKPNFTLGSFTSNCTPGQIIDTFTLWLPEGSYEVSKTLSVDQGQYAYMRDSVYLKYNTCSSLQQYTTTQQTVIAGLNTACFPNCVACRDSLGTFAAYWLKFIANASFSPADTVNDTSAYRQSAFTAYLNALSACSALCQDSLSDGNDIEGAMLQDMTPPYGQYADTDAVTTKSDIYSIFYVKPNVTTSFTPVYQYSGIVYLDANGNRDSIYDITSGLKVPPNVLSVAQFVQNFKPSWANALLPFHPEYCRLLAYQALQGSLMYDRQMEQVNDYATASALGYLNPTGNTTSPFTLFGTNTSNKDPFTSEGSNPTSLTKTLESKMQNYNNISNVAYLNIWGAACAEAHCTNPTKPCVDLFWQTTEGPGVNNIFNPSVMCTAELDMAWKYFREMYIMTKQDVIDQYIITQVKPCGEPYDSAYGIRILNTAQIYSAKHTPEFTDQALSSSSGPLAKNTSAAPFLYQINGASAANAYHDTLLAHDSLQSFYIANCQAYVSMWTQQLSPCNYDSAALATIMPGLLGVCEMACDSAHPYGASTLPSGKSFGFQHFTSFQDVLNVYNQAHPNANPLGCNAELINAPAPYGSQTIYSAMPVYTTPSTCECSLINSLHLAYLGANQGDTSFAAYLYRTQQITMSDADLTTLLNACNAPSGSTCNFLSKPIFLPPSMQCNSGEVCSSCTEINTLYQAYLVAYPNYVPALRDTVDTAQAEINLLFQNYMNNRLGYNKQAWEYLAFMDSCTAYQNSINGGTQTFSLRSDRALPSACTNLTQLKTDFLSFYPTSAGNVLNAVTNVSVKSINHIFQNYDDDDNPTTSSSDTSLASLAASRWTQNGVWFQVRDNIVFDFSHLPANLIINSAAFNLYHKDSAYEIYTQGGAHFRYTSDSLYGTFERALSAVIPGVTTWSTQPSLDNTDSVTLAPVTVPDAYQIANPNSAQIFSDQDYTQIPFTGLANNMYQASKLGSDYGMMFYLSNDSVETFGQYCFWGKTSWTPSGSMPYLQLNITATRSDLFTAYIDSALGYSYTAAQIDSMFLAACGDTSGMYGSGNVPPPPTLCGKSQPVFSSVPFDSLSVCGDSTFFAVSKATVLYQHYTDSLSGDFEARYNGVCMQAFKTENFTVTHTNNEYHYMLYYYDQAGNLVKTVPPAGVNPNWDPIWLAQVKAARAAGQVLVPSNDTLKTNYRYNTINHVVSQVSPDGGFRQFWYDRIGRLAVSQNAKQASNAQYSYTLYDSIGRIAQVGELMSSDSVTGAISRNASSLATWLSAASSTMEQITQTVYDYEYQPLEPVLFAQNLRNRIAYKQLFNTAADMNASVPSPASATYYSYDILGNMDTILQDYHQGIMANDSNRFKKIVYDYDFQSGKVDKVAYQHGYPDAFYHSYLYDADGRLTNVLTSSDSINWDNDAYYSYYLHGPLARTVIGDQQVQGFNYAYTLQGWMKAINPPIYNGTGYSLFEDGTSSSPVGANAYNLLLNYYQGDDSLISGAIGADAALSTTLGGDYRPLYNGNISSMGVNIAALGHPLLYNYRYDQLNRLVQMDAWNNTGSTWSSITKLQDFQERVAYDPNGNILQYKRNGNSTFVPGGSLAMDSLNYTYVPGTNKLDHISDSVTKTIYPNDLDSQLPGNYGYDAIGELTKDSTNGISSVQWTVYGKIQQITKSDGSTLVFTYDPSGNRISKTYTLAGGKPITTWYVRDAQGNTVAVYTSGNQLINGGDLSLVESDIYGSSRLGILKDSIDVLNNVPATPMTLPLLGQGYGVNFVRGNKLFELSNHLGNVLTTISDKKFGVSLDGALVDHFVPQIISANDYYPFGSQMPGRDTTFVGSNYRYGFNGKENDNEVKGVGNQQDYGMRIYDPRVGRFLSVDPLTGKYPELTPYQFASNMPIRALDLDGLEVFANFDEARHNMVTYGGYWDSHEMTGGSGTSQTVFYIFNSVDETNTTYQLFVKEMSTTDPNSHRITKDYQFSAINSSNTSYEFKSLDQLQHDAAVTLANGTAKVFVGLLALGTGGAAVEGISALPLVIGGEETTVGALYEDLSIKISDKLIENGKILGKIQTSLPVSLGAGAADFIVQMGVNKGDINKYNPAATLGTMTFENPVMIGLVAGLGGITYEDGLLIVHQTPQQMTQTIAQNQAAAWVASWTTVNLGESALDLGVTNYVSGVGGNMAAAFLPNVPALPQRPVQQPIPVATDVCNTTDISTPTPIH